MEKLIEKLHPHIRYIINTHKFKEISGYKESAFLGKDRFPRVFYQSKIPAHYECEVCSALIWEWNNRVWWALPLSTDSGNDVGLILSCNDCVVKSII